MRQRSLDEMITYFNQEIDKMDIDRRYKIALLGMVTAIGCTAKQTIEERKTGKWEEREASSEKVIDEWQSARCSVCGKYHTTPYMYFFQDYNYCPTCGARMRGGEK